MYAIRSYYGLRASSALIQGIFLGIMGVSILVYTIYRTQILQTPEAGLMGILGIVALLINIIAVIVLLPHRKGDANVRAVWLFSRNDALGNILVVVAAGFVFLTDTAWPDLIAAGVIASIFLRITSYNVCYTKLLRHWISRRARRSPWPSRSDGG